MRKYAFLLVVLLVASLPFIYFGVSATMDPTNHLEYKILKVTKQNVLVEVTNTSPQPFKGTIVISDGLGTARRPFSIGPNEQKTVELMALLKGGNQYVVWFENE